MIFLAYILLLSGCASITRGSSEDVIIQFEPADAQVTTSLGIACTASPCKLKVARKTPFTVTATREGYRPVTVEVITKLSGGGAAGFAGNVVAGGVIGMGIDAATGATKNHYPNPVIIKMELLDPLAAPAVVDVAPNAPQPITPQPAPAKMMQKPIGKPVS